MLCPMVFKYVVITCQVLGEYSCESPDTNVVDVTRLLLQWFHVSSDKDTQAWILQALIKIYCRTHNTQHITAISEMLPKEDTVSDNKEVYQV